MFLFPPMTSKLQHELI